METRTISHTSYLFVYGTLMKGFKHSSARKLTQNGVWCGRAYFRGTLFDLGHYPGAIYDSNSPTWVLGEVWQLSDFSKVIVTLDRYEGINEMNPEYVRQQIPITFDDNKIADCWVYLFCQSTESHVQIPHGDYRKWLLDSKQHL